jgi:K+-transporting ATPase ATPase C chain
MTPLLAPAEKTIYRLCAIDPEAEQHWRRYAISVIVLNLLISQNFTRPDYFQPRPSAVPYDASQSGGTNAAPSSAQLIAQIKERTGAARSWVGERQAPIDMVTASGSGLDPHISPASA